MPQGKKAALRNDDESVGLPQGKKAALRKDKQTTKNEIAASQKALLAMTKKMQESNSLSLTVPRVFGST